MGLKVDGNSGRKPQGVKSPFGQNSAKVREKNNTRFSSHLDQHLSQNQDEELKKRAMEIEKQGRRLSEHIDIAELKAYKRLVMEFLDEALRGASRFSKESFLDRRGRHRVFATVKTINQKLEELTKEVLSSQKNNLEIIGRIEDIRGLVLDLVL